MKSLDQSLDFIGGPGRDRTCDPKFRKLGAYKLAYSFASNLATFQMASHLTSVSLCFYRFQAVPIHFMGKTWGSVLNKSYPESHFTFLKTKGDQ